MQRLLNKNYVRLLVPFVIALIMGILFLIFKTPPVRRDSAYHLNKGIAVAEKGISHLLHEPQSVEPGYHVFLGLCFRMFPDNDMAVRGVQVLLFAMTSLLVYAFAKQYYSERVAFTASMLYSLCPTFAHYPGFFLTETLAVFLFLSSAYFLCRTIETARLSLSLLTGIVLSISLMTKYAFLFFGLFFVIFYLPSSRKRNLLRKETVMPVIIALAIPFLTFGLWLYWNVYKIDPDVKSKRRIGIVLLYNGSEIALTPEEKVARLIGLVSRNLSEKIFPQIDYQTLWPYPSIAKKLFNEADKKYQYIESEDTRYTKYAFDLYKQYPGSYLINRITTLMRLNAFQYPSRLNETDRWKDFYNRSDNKSWVMIILDLLLKTISNPLVWALGGFIMLFKKSMPLHPLLLPPLYINLIYCFLDGIPRYGLPALPFYLIAGAALFSFAFETVLKKYNSLKKVPENIH